LQLDEELPEWDGGAAASIGWLYLARSVSSRRQGLGATQN
jgi:hypothetical protein